MGQDKIRFRNHFLFCKWVSTQTVHNRYFSEFDPIKPKKEHPETREQGGQRTRWVKLVFQSSLRLLHLLSKKFHLPPQVDRPASCCRWHPPLLKQSLLVSDFCTKRQKKQNKKKQRKNKTNKQNEIKIQRPHYRTLELQLEGWGREIKKTVCSNARTSPER